MTTATLNALLSAPFELSWPVIVWVATVAGLGFFIMWLLVWSKTR